MSDSSCTKIIKRIAREAVDASKPADIIRGTVITIEPLSIQTDQKIILEKQFITVPEKLTDYEMEISFTDGEIIQGVCMRGDPVTEEACGTPEDCDGCAGYGGELSTDDAPWSRSQMRFSPPVRHKVIIHNALKEGDRVLMAACAGGQQYVVLDRVGD